MNTLPKGAIKKRVEYQKIDNNFFNLAFGDVDLETNAIDDKVITHNNDTEKILATVAKTVEFFIDEFPKAQIYAKGSSISRTRLYRIGISNNFKDIAEKFKIYGYLDAKGWVSYEKNSSYSAFLILKK